LIRVLLDTNVILDFLLKRENFYIHASRILELANNSIIDAAISATTVTDIYYLGQKQIGRVAVTSFLMDLLQFINITTVDKNIIILSLNSGFKDFEDAVQDFSAQKNERGIIITRNKSDFKQSISNIFAPDEFLQEYDV